MIEEFLSAAVSTSHFVAGHSGENIIIGNMRVIYDGAKCQVLHRDKVSNRRNVKGVDELDVARFERRTSPHTQSFYSSSQQKYWEIFILKWKILKLF